MDGIQQQSCLILPMYSFIRFPGSTIYRRQFILPTGLLIGNQRLKKGGNLYSAIGNSAVFDIDRYHCFSYFNYQMLLNICTCAKNRSKQCMFVASPTETAAKITVLAKLNSDRNQ